MKAERRLVGILITFCVLEVIVFAPCYFLWQNISGSTSEGILLKTMAQTTLQGGAMIGAIAWGDRLFGTARNWASRLHSPSN